MKKKLLSLILAGSVVASMAAIATTSASAALNADGTYSIDKTAFERTKKLYFNMPESWKNSISDTAGCYWWAGADACGAVDGGGGDLAWPGYKATYDNSLEGAGLTSLYYVEVSDDEDTRVPTVVWNNYIDGGMDETTEQYKLATQCMDSACEYLSEGDLELYDNQDGFWEAMADSYAGDKAALGDFADNFFDDGYSLYYDNMIWIVDPNNVTENPVSGKVTYGGNWYFYYGDGSYGTWPTPEDAKEKGIFVNMLSTDLIVGSAEAKKGDTVEIPITIDKNENRDVETISFNLGYDATKLELVSYKAGDAFANVETLGSTDDETGKIGFIVTGASGQKTATVMTLTFKVLTDEAGSYPINLNDLVALNESDEVATLNLTAGSITVKGEATEPTEEATKPSVPQPNNDDAKSTVDESKKKTTDNGAVQTGATSLAVVLFVVIAGATSVAFFTRRKYNQ